MTTPTIWTIRRQVIGVSLEVLRGALIMVGIALWSCEYQPLVWKSMVMSGLLGGVFSEAFKYYCRKHPVNPPLPPKTF